MNMHSGNYQPAIRGEVVSNLDLLPGGFRVGRQERDAAIRVVTNALAREMLSPEAHEARITAIMAAKSEAEIERLTGDLHAKEPANSYLRHVIGYAIAMLVFVSIALPGSMGVYESTETQVPEKAYGQVWVQGMHSGLAIVAVVMTALIGIAGFIVTVVEYADWLNKWNKQH